MIQNLSCFDRALGASLLLSLLFVTACATPRMQVDTAETEAMKRVYDEYGVSVSRRSGGTLYIGGLVAYNDEGSVIAPGDGAKQMAVIYDRLRTILAMHGATLDNVVQETLFVSDWEEAFKGAPIRIAAYDDVGATYPSMAGVLVGLVNEGAIIELTAIAELGK